MFYVLVFWTNTVVFFHGEFVHYAGAMGDTSQRSPMPLLHDIVAIYKRYRTLYLFFKLCSTVPPQKYLLFTDWFLIFLNIFTLYASNDDLTSCLSLGLL